MHKGRTVLGALVHLTISLISMSRFWSPVVRELTPYVPGEQPKLTNLVKLNTNENPFGPSPEVIAAIAKETGDTLRLYPDPGSEKLRETIAVHHGLNKSQVFVGNGSDEVLALVFLAFFQNGQPVLFPDITYSFYPVYCQLYRVPYRRIALDQGLQIQVGDYAQGNGGIIFPNPNAPTGRLLALGEIRSLLEQNPQSVVVIDEAYIDFGGDESCTSIPTSIPLINQYPNLLVVQTLSKSRSLAGLRVGFAAGSVELIDGLNRVKNSFNSYPLDRLAQAGGVAAYEDQNYFARTRWAVMQNRDQLTQNLQHLGFEVLPSAANFIFAHHPEHDAPALALQLREQGIIVRHFATDRIDQFLRITVGTTDQCRRLVEALSVIVT